MSASRLCSIHTATVLEERDVQGSGMSRKKSWLPTGREVSCRVVAQNSQALVALMQAQTRTYYLIYFAQDPLLNPLIHRLLWRGQVLRLISGVMDAHGLGRIWTVNAAAFTEDQTTRI